MPITGKWALPHCEGRERIIPFWSLHYLQASHWHFSLLRWKGTTCICLFDDKFWWLQMGWTGFDLGAYVWKVIQSSAFSLGKLLYHMMNIQPVTLDKCCCKWPRTFFFVSVPFIIRQAETFALISHLSIFFFLYPQVPAFIISHSSMHTNTINK